MGKPELIGTCVDEAATLALGEALAAGLTQAAGNGALIVYLQGSLGAGKTTLARGLLRALGVRGPVRSPTFTLVELYPCAELEVLHIDLYRIDDAADIHGLGLRDFDRAGVVWLIEWPENGRGYLPPADLVVRLEAGIAESRRVSIEAPGAGAKTLLESDAMSAWCQAS